MPDVPSAIDTPQDWFRIRLICTLLDATIVHLDHGVNKVKVDGFLTFFQVIVLHSKMIRTCAKSRSQAIHQM